MSTGVNQNLEKISFPRTCIARVYI